MAGRPRHEATPAQRLEIERLGKRMGRNGVAARTGLPAWLVRGEMEMMRLRERPSTPFSAAENAHLSAHAGEQAAPRLQRELHAISGVLRSLTRIKAQVVMLLGLGLRELRSELTMAQVAMLIGRSEQHVMSECRAKRLKSKRIDEGTSKVRVVTPSDLRLYVLADKRRVDWVRAEHDELVDLIARKWGAGEKKGKAEVDA